MNSGKYDFEGNGVGGEKGEACMCCEVGSEMSDEACVLVRDRLGVGLTESK